MDNFWIALIVIALSTSMAVESYVKSEKEIAFAKAGLQQCENDLWKKNCEHTRIK